MISLKNQPVFLYILCKKDEATFHLYIYSANVRDLLIHLKLYLAEQFAFSCQSVPANFSSFSEKKWEGRIQVRALIVKK